MVKNLKYASIEEVIRDAQAGTLPKDAAFTVDNDSWYMYADDGEECLFCQGLDMQEALVDLLQYLKVPAEMA